MARKKNRITNKRECEIETYKTRAEMIAENPVREGDEDYLRSARVCAIIGISSTTLSRWNTERPPRIPFIRLSKGNYRWRKSDVEAYLFNVLRGPIHLRRIRLAEFVHRHFRPWVPLEPGFLGLGHNPLDRFIERQIRTIQRIRKDQIGNVSPVFLRLRLLPQPTRFQSRDQF